MPGDTIILHKWIKWSYAGVAGDGYKDIAGDGYDLKKMKTSGDIIILHIYTCVPKIMITWCTVPEIWWGMDRQTDRQKDKK